MNKELQTTISTSLRKKNIRYFKCSLCCKEDTTQQSGMPQGWSKLNISERRGRGSGTTSFGGTFLCIYLCTSCHSCLPWGKNIEQKWINQLKALIGNK